jgi:hypothetical protein
MNIDKIKKMVIECHTAIINGDVYIPFDWGHDDGFYGTSEDGDEVFIEYTEIDLKRDRFLKLVLMD